MNELQTVSDISVTEISSGVFPSGVLQLARDYLAGYSGGYYFFQAADYKYILILSDDYSIVSSSAGYSIAFDECDWVLIDLVPRTQQRNFGTSDSFSGAFLEPNVTESGTFSGSSSGSIYYSKDLDPFYQVHYYHDSDGGTLYNLNSFVVYSSIDYMPHLIDGGSYYGYAQIAILLVCCFFVLLSRIFKHVS